MKEKIIDITPDVKWIGALDPTLTVFDIVMETKFGSTYNSYFINAKKKTIVETVKNTHVESFLDRIKTLCNPEAIEYIVLDHTEPDHSGSLSALLDIAPNATVVGTGQALLYLNDIMNRSFKSLKVKDGDTLDLGDRTLRFIGAPNLHWPDSMYSYLEEERLLFTCDSFGAHYCSETVFDDTVNNDEHDMAFDYYFDCILRPYSRFMVAAIEKIRHLDIATICPGHGPVLRSRWKELVDKSERLSNEYLAVTENRHKRVLLCYVSAYGYTALMAKAIHNGLTAAGNVEVEMLDIEFASLGELEAAITRSDALIVGSPTINQNTVLPVYKLLAAINPLRDRNKPAAAFGSFGWSGEASSLIETALQGLKLRIAQPAYKGKFNPGDEESAHLEAFGKSFAEKMA